MPQDAKELVLICDDPDAPSPRPWVHWVLCKIPASKAGSLPEGIGSATDSDEIPGAVHGQNSWKTTLYRGPAPPAGDPHRYFFKLYAVDTVLELNGAATNKAALLAALEGHVLAEAQWMGTYERK